MKIITRLFEYVRYQVFWLLDVMTGSKVKTHLKAIETILDKPTSEKAKTLKTEHLQALLQHAVNTTPYYKTYRPEAGLTTFPVVNKNKLNKEAALFKSHTWQDKPCKVVTTSGSTGALLSISLDNNKIKRNTADNLYFSKKVGFKIGYKLYYLRHWSAYFKKNNLIQWLQNIRPVEVVALSESKLQALIKEVQHDDSKKGWLGYASGFESICKHLDTTGAKPLKAKFKSIIAISEHLSEQTRARMAYYFEAPVVSRYSNMENGILAQQPLNLNTHYQVNWASYHIEILDLETDTPVPYGKMGRIIVTDLFNYATPMIRYDTGDLGVMDLHEGIPVLKRIEGRASDNIYNTQGNLVSSFMIIDACNFKGIHQIQLVQETKNQYTLKLNVSDAFSNENDLVSNFKTYLGKDAHITIVFVKELPVLASGKQKITENKFISTHR